MPRPRSLSHAAIAAAALGVVDRDGLAALSMRAVAVELGVGTMSLYRYVSGREQVERMVVDLVFRSVDPRVTPRATWQRQVRELCGAVRAAISTHVEVIPLLLVHVQYSPSAWRWLETLLNALDRAGFTPHQRVIAVRCLQAYIIGALQNEFVGPLASDGTHALAELSPADYPLTVETAQTAFAITPDQEFRDGLNIIIDGFRSISLRAQPARTARHSTRRPDSHPSRA